VLVGKIMFPKVSIIILNWNGWKDTIECLESLYQIDYPSYDIIVVDNASKDESIQKIKEYANGDIKVKSKYFTYNPENKPIKIIDYTNKNLDLGNQFFRKYLFLPSNRKLILIKNDQNYGFAEGNNIAVRYALKTLNSQYIIFLNNDTVVEKQFVTEMVKYAEKNEKIGIVGSKIYYYDSEREKNVIWFAGGSINKWSGKTSHEGRNKVDSNIYNYIKECDFITGCSLLIKCKLLDQLEGFDQTYFAYYEDADLSTRAKKIGWKNIYVPTSKVWHKVSRSTSKNGESSPTSVYYMTRNRIIFTKKHNSKKILYLLCYMAIYRHAACLVKYFILKRNTKLMKSFYKGLIDGLTFKD
jgi:GT2 family glycosyltransferase